MELNNIIYQQTLPHEPTINVGQASQRNSGKTPADFSDNHDCVVISNEGKAAASKNSDVFPNAQSSSSKELSQDDIVKLTELKARDVEVRAHEQAHLSAAGGHATGGATFSFQKGPDGQSYAVGGEVGVDLSKESDPNATIQKMQTIKRAALAPASPSSTDRQVAAQAGVQESQARQELLKEQQEQLLHANKGVTPIQEPDKVDDTTNNISPRISSLKASIAAYSDISAM